MNMIGRLQIAAASLVVAGCMALTPAIAAQSEKSNRMQQSVPESGQSGQGPVAPEHRRGATPQTGPGTSDGGHGDTPRANPGGGLRGCPYRNDRPLNLLV